MNKEVLDLAFHGPWVVRQLPSISPCSVCGKTFSIKGWLKKHKDKSHSLCIEWYIVISVLAIQNTSSKDNKHYAIQVSKITSTLFNTIAYKIHIQIHNTVHRLVTMYFFSYHSLQVTYTDTVPKLVTMHFISYHSLKVTYTDTVHINKLVTMHFIS